MRGSGLMASLTYPSTGREPLVGIKVAASAPGVPNDLGHKPWSLNGRDGMCHIGAQGW